MLDTVFLICAVLGGGVFVVRTALQLLGVGGAGELDGGVGDADLGAAHPDADTGFRVLSLQGIASFLMIFGLVGLALTRQSGVGGLVSLAAAAAAAVLSVFVIARIFASMGRLQSDGTVRAKNAIGQEGVVYLSIAKGSGGKVQIEVQGRLGIWDAQAVDDAPIATGQRVRVVRVASGDRLIVETIH